MPNLSLPTGNVIYVSVYEYYFLLPEDKVDEFYQELIAENAGSPAPEDPFCDKAFRGRLVLDEEPELEEVLVDESVPGDFS